MLTFLCPLIFVGLIPMIAWVVFLYFRGSKRIHFGPFLDLQKLYHTHTWYFKVYYFLLLLIATLFIVIIAKPVIKETKETMKKNGIDIQIVLDISGSMTAEDLKPNRLEVAKGVIHDFLDQRKADRVGLIIFAGKPFSSLPLNFDYNISKKIISKVSLSTIHQASPHLQGTAFGDALLLAADSFDDTSKNRGKVIILITDGEANRGLDPGVSVEYIQSLYSEEGESGKIKVYTVGIGGQEKTYIYQTHPLLGRKKIEVGGVDESTLKIIASETGGKYFRATDAKRLEKIFQEISQLEKTEIEVDTIETHTSKSIHFVWALMILFLLFYFVKLRKNII